MGLKRQKLALHMDLNCVSPLRCIFFFLDEYSTVL